MVESKLFHKICLAVCRNTVSFYFFGCLTSSDCKSDPVKKLAYGLTGSGVRIPGHPHNILLVYAVYRRLRPAVQQGLTLKVITTADK